MNTIPKALPNPSARTFRWTLAKEAAGWTAAVKEDEWANMFPTQNWELGFQ